MKSRSRIGRSVLLVGARSVSTWQLRDAGCVLVPDLDAATELIRDQTFDLVVVDIEQIGPAAWNFIRALKCFQPDQRWTLMGGQCSSDEIRARALGATAAVESAPRDVEQVLSALRQMPVGFNPPLTESVG